MPPSTGIGIVGRKYFAASATDEVVNKSLSWVCTTDSTIGVVLGCCRLVNVGGTFVARLVTVTVTGYEVVVKTFFCGSGIVSSAPREDVVVVVVVDVVVVGTVTKLVYEWLTWFFRFLLFRGVIWVVIPPFERSTKFGDAAVAWMYFSCRRWKTISSGPMLTSSRGTITGRLLLPWATIRVRLEMCGRGSFVPELFRVAAILVGSCFGRFRLGIHLSTGFSVVVVVTLEREY